MPEASSCADQEANWNSGAPVRGPYFAFAAVVKKGIAGQHFEGK